jgi:hypothetical protein
MTNPLIDKFYELHPEKKEKPKPDYYKGEKSYAEELKKEETNIIVKVLKDIFDKDKKDT